ncbi:MAG: threonine-phosphate decarboxylase [Rhizobiaceae bacterium]|nr:threonine-phosphate decarboxylase [Rhizobiaceae bacterium]
MRLVEEDAGSEDEHGGNLAAARRRFPDAVQPWIDLSTGISPFPYPHSPVPATAFERLPEPEDEVRLREIAARAYSAPSADNIVAAPGTQILLPMVFALRAPGRAVVVGPTYAEHMRVAALSGHECGEASGPAELKSADLAVVVNPNNPDGRVFARGDLLAVAEELAPRGGLLVVDEAFMDVGPEGGSLASDVEKLPIVVLRSFGKFHGLAGIRLGFAVASAEIAARLRDRLGPWAVSGPAMTIGMEALADADWRPTQRAELDGKAQRLRALLEEVGLEIVGGTSLFQLATHEDAARLHSTLAEQGILTRRFGWNHEFLRFGLPGDEASWGRLANALQVWSQKMEG